MSTFYKSVDNKRGIVRVQVKDLFTMLKDELLCVSPLINMAAMYD